MKITHPNVKINTEILTELLIDVIEKSEEENILEKEKIKEIELIDIDLDRMYLSIDGEVLWIRTWDIIEDEKEIFFSWGLFGTQNNNSICYGQGNTTIKIK